MKKKSISLNPSLTRGTFKKSNGFTLFELLVSISIIGILTALASVAFSGAQKKARDARRMEDIKNIQTAAELYYSVNTFVYPTSINVAWTGPGAQSILDKYPTDPKNNAVNGYIYTQPTFTTSAYCHCAKVESTANGNSVGNNCDFIGAGTKLYFCAKNQQ